MEPPPYVRPAGPYIYPYLDTHMYAYMATHFDTYIEASIVSQLDAHIHAYRGL